MGIKKIVNLLLLQFALFSSQVFAAYGDSVIYNSSGTVAVQTMGSYGGAIVGLWWVGSGGINHINNYDHGRQIQTAAFLNNLCEYNPTEAGDKFNNATDVIYFAQEAPNAVFSVVKPRYWLPKNSTPISSPQGSDCAVRQIYSLPYSDSVSPDVFYKRITVGIGPIEASSIGISVADAQRVIKYEVTVESHTGAYYDIEAPTGYLDGIYNSFYCKDGGNNYVKMATVGGFVKNWATQLMVVSEGESAGSRAMGIWSPGAKMGGAIYNNGGDVTLKWAAHQYAKINSGNTFSMVTYIVVGTFGDVKSMLNSRVSNCS